MSASDAIKNASSDGAREFDAAVAKLLVEHLESISQTADQEFNELFNETIQAFIAREAHKRLQRIMTENDEEWIQTENLLYKEVLRFIRNAIQTEATRTHVYHR
jgi:hypothetical protein